MHSWSFGKHKRKYITDNDIDMKFCPDVINSPDNSRKNKLAREIHLTFCPQ